MVKLAWLFTALGLLAGCGAGTDPAATTSTAAGGGEGGGGDGGDESSAKSSGSGDGGENGASVSVGSTGAGGAPQVAEAYGHSASQLFRLNIDDNAVGTVGNFTGCTGQVIDIALDKDSVLYGTTQGNTNPNMPGVPSGALWRIDKNTAACTLISYGDYPNSLSFVPEGTLDANKETLVGYSQAGNYVRIDTTTGAVTTVGTSVLTGGLESSGDIVSVIDGPTYLTVKGGSCDVYDCVVEVNPTTGAMIRNLGSCGYNSVFGVAFWAGKVYGFTSEGEIFEFHEEDDGSISTLPIPASVDQFYGAGSTTAAPPTDVPN